jgi:hypothetical protein
MELERSQRRRTNMAKPRVVERTTTRVWLLDAEDSGEQRMCCDGWHSDDFVCSKTKVSEPREATDEEMEAIKKRTF